MCPNLLIDSDPCLRSASELCSAVEDQLFLLKSVLCSKTQRQLQLKDKWDWTGHVCRKPADVRKNYNQYQTTSWQTQTQIFINIGLNSEIETNNQKSHVCEN